MENESTTSSQFQAYLQVFKYKYYERWIGEMNVIFRFQDVVEIVYDDIHA